MCGIAGCLDLDRALGDDALRDLAWTMADALRHRGPDGGGTWADERAGIALGHRRLAIIDTTDAGDQPMTSASGRFVLTYNGELYNADEIAAELGGRGVRFRGHCDTEVLVEAIDTWGVEGALPRCNGMFAFGVWDRDERRLTLARDRLGEKPLYYGWSNRRFLFGSELAALRAVPGFAPAIDHRAVAAFLRFSCVPAPRSIYEGIRKLPPATVLAIDTGAALHPGVALDPVPYWSLDGAFAARTLEDDPDALEELDALLNDAVRRRLRSDVPLGAFLSGGIDSSLVVALMQAHSSRPVRTFTIGTTARSYNEADVAHEVAQHLGTRHTELLVTAADALGAIPELPRAYDEPFADSSQLPTLLVARLAREEVTVCLSGDGGDELFGGYDRYRWVPRTANRLGRVPRALRRSASATLLSVPPRAWEIGARALPARVRPRIPATKVAKLATILAIDSPAEMYGALRSHWDDPAPVLVDPAPPDRDPWGGEPGPGALGPGAGIGGPEWMMHADTGTYLPDDILVKLDRATMSVGLEARVPLLDHRVVELAAALPIGMKIRAGTSKWALRELLHRRVPAALVERPKAGFGVPLGTWLRGPLRAWAEDLLSAGRLRTGGLFRSEAVRAMWAEHLDRRRDWEYHLWDVLMLQAWLDTDRTRAGGPRPSPAPRRGSSL